MAKVKVRPHESVEQALRRFNREVQKEGIMDELKRREFYERPSLVKRREDKIRKSRAKRFSRI